MALKLSEAFILAFVHLGGRMLNTGGLPQFVFLTYADDLVLLGDNMTQYKWQATRCSLPILLRLGSS